MKYAVLFTTAAALALAACNETEEATADAAAPAAEATEAAAAPAAAAFTAGQPPSKEFMVGIWGESAACNDPIDFQADGTVKDGPMDTWKIEAGQLVMDDLVKLTLTVVDAETMQAQLEGEPETKTLKRCD